MYDTGWEARDMADARKRLADNVQGSLFVDSTCINCDTCRQLAPRSFVEKGDYSVVYRQPDGPGERLQAYQALLACPVGSIGDTRIDRGHVRAAKASFPIPIDGPVFYLGFNSAKSFGGSSYFVAHPQGNWMIDSPRYLAPLVRFIEQHGGLRYLFLTHEDDVAEADRYARRFGATRIIHRADLAAQPGAEWVIDGVEPVAASPDVLIIPTPGHTPGSMALLHSQRYLFSGDHLWWDREARAFRTPRVYVWSAKAIRRSTAALLEHCFTWVLPGHGERVHLSAREMRKELQRAVRGLQLTAARAGQ